MKQPLNIRAILSGFSETCTEVMKGRNEINNEQKTKSID